MTLAAMLDDAAARSPHAIAIHTSAGSLSYADLADRVARVAHGFISRGLTGQDRLAFLLPNGVELAISLLAAAKAGLMGRTAEVPGRQLLPAHVRRHRTGAPPALLPQLHSRAARVRRYAGHRGADRPAAFDAVIEPGAGHVLSPAMWPCTRAWFRQHL